MKTKLIILGIIMLLIATYIPSLVAGHGKLIDVVDVGCTKSELGHKLSGWGPIEPLTHGGSWGGICDCRVTWWNKPSGTDGKAARLSLYPSYSELCENFFKIDIDALDGTADDSFKVLIRLYCPSDGRLPDQYSNWECIYTYCDICYAETWKCHEIPINLKMHFRSIFWPIDCEPELQIKIQATGPQWGGWATYGQLGIDKVSLWSN